MFFNTQLKYGVMVSPLFGLCIDDDSELFNLSAEEIGNFILDSKTTVKYLYDIEIINNSFAGGRQPLISCVYMEDENERLFLAFRRIDENPYSKNGLRERCNDAMAEYRSYLIDLASRRNPHNALRRKIIVRDKSTCQYCGIDATNRIHIDHVFPYHLGGKTEPKNLVVSCSACNLRKSGKTLHEVGMKLRKSPRRENSKGLHQ